MNTYLSRSDPAHGFQDSGIHSLAGTPTACLALPLTPNGGHVGFHFRGRPRPFFLDVTDPYAGRHCQNYNHPA